MADERWKRLAEQQGVAYAKTVAEAMKLKLDMDNPADREKLRRAVLDLVAGRNMPKAKSSLTISARPVGVRAVFQPWVLCDLGVESVVLTQDQPKSRSLIIHQ